MIWPGIVRSSRLLFCIVNHQLIVYLKNIEKYLLNIFHLVLSNPFSLLRSNAYYDSSAKKILVTCALPYANGSIHLAICWSTSRLMSGSVTSECAARGQLHLRRRCPRYTNHVESSQLGITPEQMIGEMSQEHQTVSQALTSAMTTITRRTAKRTPVVRTYLLSPERKRFY